MTLEPNAITKLKEILHEENNPNLKLRVFVQGGGCSGFQYGFTFDEDQNEDDFEFGTPEVKILVDAMSMQYLQGASIEYRDDFQGSNFIIQNPNAATSCGCGNSFSI
jgi:iron-sulfur cluster insertion protein